MKLIATMGLPASGKTTWALQYLKDHPGTKRVNKDDLRKMLHGGVWSQKLESDILFVRDQIIKNFLFVKHDVIVDDTNLADKHIITLKKIADEVGAEFEIQNFTDVPLEECVTRDRKRSNYVGEKVIRDMHKRFLTIKEPKNYEFNPELARCIIVDIDGTLAIMGKRSPFEWSAVGIDTVNKPIKWLVQTLQKSKQEPKIIIFSGRDGSCRKETEGWLFKNGIDYDFLYMREEQDMRKDSIVKKELFEKHIEGHYNVMMVIDDRNQVVDMWRNELGLTCLQVADGDF